MRLRTMMSFGVSIALMSFYFVFVFVSVFIIVLVRDWSTLSLVYISLLFLVFYTYKVWSILRHKRNKNRRQPRDIDSDSLARARRIFNELCDQAKTSSIGRSANIELIRTGYPVSVSWPTGVHILYVPESFLADESDDVVKAIFAHELGHMIQMPSLFLLVMRIASFLVQVLFLFGLVSMIGVFPW